MEIRKATLTDVGAVYQLGQNVPEFEVNAETVTFWPQTIVRSAVLAKDTLFFVAETGGKVVGFIIAAKALERCCSRNS